MKKILSLLMVVSMLSGCLYVPFDARADYPNAGRGHDRGHSGHEDRGEHRGHDD